MPYGPTSFQLIVIKPYYVGKEVLEVHKQNKPSLINEPSLILLPSESREPVQRRSLGRLKGSRNSKHVYYEEPRRSKRYHFTENNKGLEDFNNQFATEEVKVSIAFITNKEKADIELLLKL